MRYLKLNEVSFISLNILFTFRERGREGERERNMDVQEIHQLVGCLSHAPNQGPGLQPRHVPRLGIELVTFRLAGQHSIH